MLCKLREQNPAFFASYDAKKGEIFSTTTMTAMVEPASASVSTSTAMTTSSSGDDARAPNSSSSEDDDEGNCNNGENDESSSDDDAVVPLSACNAARFSRELSDSKQRELELRQSQALSRLSLLAHRDGASTPL